MPNLNAPLTLDERAAMRAYLQRTEVRLSTMHRVATAFISGAGLLLLIPVFFKDALDRIIEIMLNHVTVPFDQLGMIGGIALHVTLLYPFFLSFVIPLFGMYLLLKDLVHFYYTIYSPETDQHVFTPAFSVTGIGFSPDESPNVKELVREYEYSHMRLMTPFSSKKRALYFDTVYEATDGEIIPASRRDLPDSVTDPEMARQFNVALGLARSVDRALAKEVAVTEMMLVRGNLYLRRLMLRYVKILLMFLWTMLVAFLMLPFLVEFQDSPRIFFVLALVYFAWSLGVLPIMSTPIRWLYRHRRHDGEDDSAHAHVDVQLRFFEMAVRRYCHAAIVSSFVSVILTAVMVF